MNRGKHKRATSKKSTVSRGFKRLMDRVEQATTDPRKHEQVVIEVAAGSPAARIFREAAAKVSLSGAEAGELRKVATAFRPRGKRGPKFKVDTMLTVERIARMSLQPERPSQRTMAQRLKMDYEKFRVFLKKNRSHIEAAMSRLAPNPAVF